MTCREPFTLLFGGVLWYVLVTGFALGTGGGLFWWLYEENNVGCHLRNKALIEDGRHGPLEGCAK